ncbi:MAG: hypothetical protein E6I84_16895 [Chloroflexi bacterium]|nr:MAG: hypothetical protein E6I84_16895 [Chloroflexota bacterium]
MAMVSRRAVAVALCLFSLAGSARGEGARAIEGVFVHFGYDARDNAMPAKDLPAYFAELASIGIDTIVIDQVRPESARNCEGTVVRVVLAEDHAVVRQGLKALLE